MNVLVVDDERYSVKAICECVHWNVLSEETVEVYKAYNSAQAKKIFAEVEIDILICDVEMPRENGIELIRWLRAAGKETEVIIITCHAEFEYAKEAISLGVREYCVKPLDFVLLENYVRKLMEKITEKKGKLQKQIYGGYWVEEQTVFRNEFWRQLLEGKMTDERISNQVRKCKLPWENYQLYIVLISIRKVNMNFVKWDQGKIKNSLKNIASDVFRGNMESEGILEWEDMLVAVWWDHNQHEVWEKCEKLVTMAKNMLSINICCYISNSCKYEQAKEYLRKLINTVYGDVQHLDGVYQCKFDTEKKKKIYVQIPKKIFEKMELGQFEGARFECRLWVDRSLKEMNVGREELKQIREDFIQKEYLYLSRRGIEASAFEQNDILENLYQISTESLENFKLWLESTLQTVEQLTKRRDSRMETPIERIQMYIEKHLSEELTREEIADAVYMNVDYMSRIFKRETGKSVMEYVGWKRIERAVFLMQTTSDSVSEIAEKTGFINISHFSTAFKKVVGMSPSDFRKQQEKSF